MRSSSQLFRSRLLKALAGLMAAGALLALPVASQTVEQQPTPAPEDTAEESGEDTIAESAAPAPAESSEDPFDYEASEQISEDLSVSFPVDI